MTKRKKLTALAFLIIFALGAFPRLVGLNWDQDQHLHPDERFLTMVGMDIKWPKNIKEYLNTRLSPLNPYNQGHSFFVYGTLPLFLNKKLALVLNHDNYDDFNLLGRQLAAFFDLGTLILVGLSAKKLLPGKNWLWAPFFYSISVLPIQLAHFFTVDPFLNFFLVLAFLFLVDAQKSNRPFCLGLSGIALGAALACKASAALFCPLILFFLIIKLKKEKSLQNFFIRGIVFSLTCFFSFRLFQPYAFTGLIKPNPQFLANLAELRSYQNPASTYPPSLQWVKNNHLFFPAKNLFLFGLGPILGIISLLSFSLTPLSFFKKRKNLFLAFAWFMVLEIFVFHGLQFAKPSRYFLPCFPFLCLTNAYFINSSVFLGKKKLSPKLLKAALFSLIIILLVWPLSFLRIYCQPHSRITASAWIYQHLPTGATLSCEYWDDCLPLFLPNNNPAAYQKEIIDFYPPDDAQKWQKINQQLAKVNFLIISSNRVWKPMMENPERYPQTAQFYQDLFAGRLAWEKLAEFTSYPGFPPFGKPWFIFKDEEAEESFTVYDHPRVIIFQKTQETKEEQNSLSSSNRKTFTK